MYQWELSYILSLRGINIPSAYTKTDCFNCLRYPPTQEELLSLESWKKISLDERIKYLVNNVYKKYTKQELKTMLEIKNNYSFPMPLASISEEKLLAYFHMKGLKIIFDPPHFTNEQLQLFEKIQTKHVIVVNAGPGTGKTTTCCQRADLFKDEGVLLISYTNAAINEDYKKLHEYGGMKGKLGKKDYTKLLNVTTVDSLACFINKELGDNSHDDNIRSAIERLKYDSLSRNLFYTQLGKPLYNHIIVDECQDIDDLRGELILCLFQVINMNSLCLFGDPRQKIRTNAGQWYTDLWSKHIAITEKKYSYLPIEQSEEFDLEKELFGCENITVPQQTIECQELIIDNIIKIGFTISFRFHNKKMIDLVNSLSKRRSYIHHQLEGNSIKYDETPIELIDLIDGNEDRQIQSIAYFIKNILHGQHNVPFNEIMIVGPSLERDNKTSILAQKICCIFKLMGIPFYTHTEGSYKPNAILFSTIQSVKGLECDFLFAFGISSYPSCFSMIPYNEGESLNYVLHSRSRKKIYYISNGNFSLPRGIVNDFIKLNQEFVTNCIGFKDEPDLIKYSVVNTSKDFEFHKLLSTNGYTIEIEDLDDINTYLPSKPSNFTPTFWGTLCGMGVQIFLSGNYPLCCLYISSKNYKQVSFKKYNKMVSSGEIIKGMLSDGTLIISEGILTSFNHEEFIKLTNIVNKSIYDLTFDDFVILAMFYEYSSNSFVDRNNLNGGSCDMNLVDIFQLIASDLTQRFGSCVSVERSVKLYDLRGSIDSLHQNYVIEFKTTDKEEFSKEWFYQTFIYSAILYNENRQITTPILVNLYSGKCVKILSPRHHSSWVYILDAYVKLKHHNTLVNHSISLKKELNQIPDILFEQNTFTIDTEFKNYIFDIAIINVNSIFESIIQPVNVRGDDLIFAVSWLNQPEELFTNALTMNDIKQLFERLINRYKTKPMLYYYIADTDINWANNVTAVNVGKFSREYALKHGMFLNSTQPPKLTDLYNSTCSLIDLRPYIKPHTAVSDALMLHEIVKTQTL